MSLSDNVARPLVAVATHGGARRLAPLIAAYREGWGLVAVAVVHGPAATRIAALQYDHDALAAEEVVAARWWCRRRSEADRVVAAAIARLRRREANEATDRPSSIESSDSQVASSAAVSLACESIAGAATRLNVVLFTEEEISAEAIRMIGRVDEEMEKLQQAGELKALNRAYRAYRIDASARGETIVRYAEWMGNYRENLVRKLAATLRYT